MLGVRGKRWPRIPYCMSFPHPCIRHPQSSHNRLPALVAFEVSFVEKTECHFLGCRIVHEKGVQHGDHAEVSAPASRVCSTVTTLSSSPGSNGL